MAPSPRSDHNPLIYNRFLPSMGSFRRKPPRRTNKIHHRGTEAQRRNQRDYSRAERATALLVGSLCPLWLCGDYPLLVGSPHPLHGLNAPKERPPASAPKNVTPALAGGSAGMTSVISVAWGCFAAPGKPRHGAVWPRFLGPLHGVVPLERFAAPVTWG